MLSQPDPSHELNRVQEEYKSLIRSALKTLLEEKHLYQSVNLDVSGLVPPRNGLVPSSVQYPYYQFIRAWSLHADDSRVERRVVGSNDFGIRIPDLKLYCKTCNRIEAFNSVNTYDSLAGLGLSRDDGARTLQVFVLSYRCQSCKGAPEVLLVRRFGSKLTLSGRSPIEFVEVPKFIPGQVSQFYSGAVVAHQSGQTLAGNFLLRTLIEQWVYLHVAPEDRFADRALEIYASSLEADFKRKFPSLTDVYSKLSADIHAATGSTDIFDSERGRIVGHFDARRVYGMPQNVAPPASDTEVEDDSAT